MPMTFYPGADQPEDTKHPLQDHAEAAAAWRRAMRIPLHTTPEPPNPAWMRDHR